MSTPLLFAKVLPPTGFRVMLRFGEERLLRVGVYFTERADELASEALLDRRDRCDITGIREGGDWRGGDCTDREEGRDCLGLADAVVALLCER